MGADDIRSKINKLVKEFFDLKAQPKPFEPGKTKIHYNTPYYDHNEATAFINSFLDGWFGVGKAADQFEKELSRFVGKHNAVLTNSGSSANLLALTSFTSPKSRKRLKPGDEVIHPASSFPTTVNPTIQNNLKPVFIDSELGTYNSSFDQIRDAVTKDTKAIMFAHTLGNPYEMDAIMELAEEKNLIVIEDTCDALGSEYANKQCGSFGHLSTNSYYPAHHITMGEGGAVLCDDLNQRRIVRSFREWGRSCYCEYNENDSLGACGKRFSWQLGKLPKGYDHKYIYEHIGYNLKPLEFQAAFGLHQLKRLPKITELRRKNFNTLNKFMQDYQDYLTLPQSLPKARPSWFAYPISVKESAPFKRIDLVTHLEKANIQTRFLFTGNITRHPAYENIQARVVGGLKNADMIIDQSFFMGIQPNITDEMMDYIKQIITEFMVKNKIKK